MIPIFNVLSVENTLVADRIYRDLAPEEVTYPYVTWFLTGGEALNDKDEPSIIHTGKADRFRCACDI